MKLEIYDHEFEPGMSQIITDKGAYVAEFDNAFLSIFEKMVREYNLDQ